MTNTMNNVEREEKKATLYNKLKAFGNEIPLNGFIEGQFSSYEPKKDYYIYDKEIINSIKRKIIEPHESNPVVENVINGQSTILEVIKPIEDKAAQVQKEYEQVRFIKKFDPEKEIFEENENLIAKELEDILDIKKTYEKSFIASEKYNTIVDRVFGTDTKRFGDLRPMLISLRNGLPFALGAVYFVGPISGISGSLVEKYPIIGDIMVGFLGELSGVAASLGSSLFFIHEGSDKIGKETDRLKKQAQFLDETITELYK